MRKERAGRRMVRKEPCLRHCLIVLLPGIMMLAFVVPQILTHANSLEKAQEVCRTTWEQRLLQEVEAMALDDSQKADYKSISEKDQNNYLLPSHALNAAAAVCSVICLSMWMIFGSQIASSDVYDQRRTCRFPLRCTPKPIHIILARASQALYIFLNPVSIVLAMKLGRSTYFRFWAILVP